MLAKILSAAVIGVDGYVVRVEVDLAVGLPAFSTVGLAEGAVRESKDRVRSAIKTAATISRPSESPSTWRRPR